MRPDYHGQGSSELTCSHNPGRAIYCYEDGALDTFRAAKQSGLRCFYDLPIAYWRTSRELLAAEAERWPRWEPTLVGTRDSAMKCARKDEELELADCIICPSQFVHDSLPKAVKVGKPIHVIPFGSPTINRPRIQSAEDHSTPSATGIRTGASAKHASAGKLRVLFAGSMTQRKGLADLFAAMKLLDPDHYELHILGSPVAPMAFYRQQHANFVHHGSRSHEGVLALMQTMDVFVLPSIVEGRALVQQEALACGLPIIVTANAGAEDLVEDQSAGFLVPIRDPESIATTLKTLHNDRERLVRMSAAAVRKAASVTWESYRRQIVESIQSNLDATPPFSGSSAIGSRFVPKVSE